MSSPEPAVDPGPYDLPGAGGAAALCLHGLTGTPYEIRPLAEALAARGVRAVGPALPGHNTRIEDLIGTRYEEWVEAARAQLRALRAEHESVYVLGVSMGGLVSLTLAAEEQVEGVVCVAAPLHLHPVVTTLVPLARHVLRVFPKRGGADIRDPAARARHPSYPGMPLAAVHELTKLQRRVRGLLAQVTAPILVAHGVHDATANPADAREILARVGSAVQELLLLEDSAHVVPVDRDGPRLAQAAADFLLAARPAPAGESNTV